MTEIECLLTLCTKLNIPYYEWKGTPPLYPNEYIIFNISRIAEEGLVISDTINTITTFLNTIYENRDYGTYIDNTYKYYEYDKSSLDFLLLCKYTYHYNNDSLIVFIANMMNVDSIPIKQLLTPYNYLLTVLNTI